MKKHITNSPVFDLATKYIDLIDDYDPFRDKDEDPDNLEEMLYNLQEIIAEIPENETDAQILESKAQFEALINEFKAEGITASI